MNLLATILHHWSDRAVAVSVSLILALLSGWLLGPVLRPSRLLAAAQRLASQLGRKLNREGRSTATRAWRGVVVTALLAIPAFILGHVCDLKLGDFAVLPLFLIFMPALGTHRMLVLLRQARSGTLALQIDRPHYVFADSFGLLRYMILAHATSYAIGIVGVSFWYILGGFSAAFTYLALALAAQSYAVQLQHNRAFGGVANGLFALVDTLPRLLAALFLSIAAFFIPGAKPFSALASIPAAFRRWALFVANLLHIALGGPTPVAGQTAQLPWVGNGTPKPDASDLVRWLLVWAVGLVLIVALALPAVMLGNL